MQLFSITVHAGKADDIFEKNCQVFIQIIIWVGERDAWDEGEHLQVLSKEGSIENFHQTLRILGVKGVG